MTRCWEYVPRKRPTCENIRETLQNQSIKARPPTQSTNTTEFWKEIKSRSDIRVTRAENTILKAASIQDKLVPTPLTKNLVQKQGILPVVTFKIFAR